MFSIGRWRCSFVPIVEVLPGNIEGEVRNVRAWDDDVWGFVRSDKAVQVYRWWTAEPILANERRRFCGAQHVSERRRLYRHVFGMLDWDRRGPVQRYAETLDLPAWRSERERVRADWVSYVRCDPLKVQQKRPREVLRLGRFSDHALRGHQRGGCLARGVLLAQDVSG